MRRVWRRRRRWRRRWTARRATRVLGLVAIAVGAFATLSPSTWIAGGVDMLREVFGTASPAATLSGFARVIDGDTLVIRGIRIRLRGIDAPESAQRCRVAGRAWPCGWQATRALSGRIGERKVVCEGRDRDRYGRTVAVCWVAGENLNAWMASEGWAFAYRKYSLRYLALEWAARAADRGIWRGEVLPPWDWRKGERLQ